MGPEVVPTCQASYANFQSARPLLGAEGTEVKAPRSHLNNTVNPERRWWRLGQDTASDLLGKPAVYLGTENGRQAR